MKENVVIWKESVYKNGFKCKCGHAVASVDGTKVEIADDTLIENLGFRTWVYCGKCNSPVAYLKYMDIPKDASGMMGSITEYERRKMN